MIHTNRNPKDLDQGKQNAEIFPKSPNYLNLKLFYFVFNKFRCHMSKVLNYPLPYFQQQLQVLLLQLQNRL